MKILVICILLSGCALQGPWAKADVGLELALQSQREDREDRSEREACREWFVLYEQIYDDLFQQQIVETITLWKFFSLSVELQRLILRALRDQAREQAIFEACP